MLAYIVRRIMVMVPMMLVATLAMFLMISLTGDPLAEMRMMQPPPPPEVLARMAAELRLDQPILTQYWMWLTGVLQGDFGPSLRGTDIGAEVWSRLFVSLRLLTIGLVLAFVLTLVATVIGAVFHFSIGDHVLSIFAVVMISMPVFWFALLLKRAAVGINRSLEMRLFYTVGDGSGIPTDGVLERMLLLFGVLALPTIALSMQAFGTWSRYGRVALIEALSSEYVKLARAKGLSETRVVLAHGLRTALAPIVTVVAAGGAVILGESVVTEVVFQWRGLGDLLVTGIQTNDVYVVLAWLLIAGIIIMVFNLVADILYALLDPRIRYER